MNPRRNLIHISFLILFLFPAMFFTSIAQAQSGEVKRAFQDADADMLGNYFGTTVTLNIPGKDLQCSRAEAKENMKDFFASHRVKSFNIKFEGEKDNSNFIIGTLVTGSGTYRVNIFFKKNGDSKHIHLLRIEKEHGSAH